MKIFDVALSELKAYKNNPRKIPSEAVDAVVNSIKEFGFKVPVIIDSDNVLIAGHTRVEAAKKLGFTEVPCVIADDLNEQQMKAFRLADNKTSELSSWDFEKLDVELKNLDFNMAEFGFNEHVFDESFIDDLMRGMEGSSKTEGDYFSISFTIEKEYKSRFDDYVKEHGKNELKNILIGAVLDNA